MNMHIHVYTCIMTMRTIFLIDKGSHIFNVLSLKHPSDQSAKAEEN